MTTDRIEKTTLLRAPLHRVWQAISDSSQFGEWFGLRAAGPFVAGETVHCTMVPTTVDPEVAEQQRQFEGFEFDIWVDEVVPEQRLSFRWLPHIPAQGADPEAQPKTQVVFVLEERGDGVLLTITESGFDALPSEIRAKSFASNDEGWTHQLRMIETYVASG